MNATADKVSPFVATSAALHVALFVFLAFGTKLFPKSVEEPWGTASNSIRVGMTSSLPGIPLPSPAVVRDKAKPSDTKTLHPAEVAPKPEQAVPPKPAAIKIPERGARTEPKATASRAPKADPVPAADAPPTNAIPGEKSGQVPLPYGQGGAGQASFGGDGTFGTRFPEYVTNLTRAIEAQWQQPDLRGSAPRVYVTFTIRRNGSRADATNVQLVQQSGSNQLDRSAVRAVTTATLPPLPREYSGSSVDVRFYFESKR
jgi:protein TonB